MHILLAVVIPLIFIYTDAIIGDPEICTISSIIDKNPGFEDILNGYKSDQMLIPSWNGTAKTKEKCFMKCKLDMYCQMAEHNHRNLGCKTFNKTGINISYCCSTYIWKFCDFNYGSSVKNRCSGKWLLNKGYILQSDNYKYFSYIITVINIHQCQKTCLKYDVCGGVNYFKENKTCIIVEIYNLEDIKYDNNDKSDAYVWKCAIYQDYNLPKMCSLKLGKCNGMFKKTNSIMLKNKLIQFTTRSYMICLENCLQYSNCYDFIFSEKYSYCVIFSSIKIVCTNPRPFTIDSSYSFFKWTCCMTEDFQLYNTDTSNDKTLSLKQEQSNVLKCACIKNAKYLQVKPYNCNAYIPKWDFSKKYNCNEAKIQCDVGQCFYILNRFYLSNKLFWLVYTGYESFVLGNATENMDFYKITQICDYFNAKRIPIKLNIISRSSWFAMEYSTKEKMKLKLKYIVIGNLQTKLCFCKTDASCQDEIRYHQRIEISKKKKDFDYNFMIAPTGGIYEGSGWLYKYSRESLLKEDFLFIAFVGNYSDGRPYIPSLNAAKQLIYDAVKNGYVVEKYILYVAPSIQIGKFKDAISLYHIIGLWKNYKGRKKIKCDIFNVITFGLNIITTLSVGIIIIILIKYKCFTRHNLHCQNILSNIENIYDFSLYCDEKVKDFYKMPQEYDFKKREENINMNYTDFYWLSKKSEILVKLKHKRNCLSSVNALLRFYYLTNRPLTFSIFFDLPSIKYCNHKTIIVICKSKSLLRRKIIIIVHLEGKVSPTIFKSLIAKLHSKRCFCEGFDINLLSKFRYVYNKFINYQVIDHT